MGIYLSKNSSKFRLQYHLIFVVKYRKPLLMKYGDEIKSHMQLIANRYDFSIDIMEVDKDHIHLLVSSEPKYSPLEIVKLLKQQSTYMIWKNHPELNQYFWSGKHVFWTKGYFVSTIGEVSEATIKHYIENQG